MEVKAFEWIQVAINAIGALVTIFWIRGCVQNLRLMYRRGKNGVMELQAWEKITVGLLLLSLQMMWFFSGLSTIYRFITDVDTLRVVNAIRGSIGSFMLLMIIMYKRWSWARIIFADEQQNRNKES